MKYSSGPIRTAFDVTCLSEFISASFTCRQIGIVTEEMLTQEPLPQFPFSGVAANVRQAFAPEARPARIRFSANASAY